MATCAQHLVRFRQPIPGQPARPQSEPRRRQDDPDDLVTTGPIGPHPISGLTADDSTLMFTPDSSLPSVLYFQSETLSWNNPSDPSTNRIVLRQPHGDVSHATLPCASTALNIKCHTNPPTCPQHTHRLLTHNRGAAHSRIRRRRFRGACRQHVLSRGSCAGAVAVCVDHEAAMGKLRSTRLWKTSTSTGRRSGTTPSHRLHWSFQRAAPSMAGPT